MKALSLAVVVLAAAFSIARADAAPTGAAAVTPGAAATTAAKAPPAVPKANPAFPVNRSVQARCQDRAPDGRFVATAFTIASPSQPLRVVGGQPIRPGSRQVVGGTLERLVTNFGDTPHPAVPATPMRTTSGALVTQPVQLERRGRFFQFTPAAAKAVTPTTKPAAASGTQAPSSPAKP